MTNQMLRLDPQTVRQGISWALPWTNGPILVVVTPESIRFQVVNEHRFVATWEWMVPTHSAPRFFLIPPFVASILAAPNATRLTSIHVQIDRTRVSLLLRDKHGEYIVQWQWDGASFAAPPFFDQMAHAPREMLERQTFIAIADAVHLAIANLGRLEAMEQVNRQNLAIVVDFSPGHFKIDGQPITVGHEQRYYFDPRLIVRGLEIARGKHIGFAVSTTPQDGLSVLYMTSERENWHIQSSLLSLQPDESTTILTQQVRPRSVQTSG